MKNCVDLEPCHFENHLKKVAVSNADSYTAIAKEKANTAYKNYRLNVIRPAPEAEAIEKQNDGRILFSIPGQKYDTRISVSQNYITDRMRETL